MQSHFFQRIQNREHMEGLRTFWFERIRALLEDSVPNLTNLGTFRGHLRNFGNGYRRRHPNVKSHAKTFQKMLHHIPYMKEKFWERSDNTTWENFSQTVQTPGVGKIIARKNEKKSIKFGRSNSAHEPIDCNKNILEPCTAHGLATRISEF